MKEWFPGYYNLSGEEFKELWKVGRFVFDASVLLNLYRFPTKAREDLLKVMTKLKGRLWIPFHVALEFQRNRHMVISEQQKRFSQFRKILEGAKQKIETDLQPLQLRKRHSSIDQDLYTRK